MRKCILVLPLLAMTLTGCPPIEWPQPPFDTSGTYSGAWSGQASGAGAPQQVEDCPLTLSLAQDVNANYPGDHAVTGTAIVDYSCLQLPEWVGDVPPSEVGVVGILGDDGNMTLVSGGCGTGLCAVLSLAGTGTDADEDGTMDMYAGTWSFSLLLAGVQPLTVTGTFELLADAIP